MRDFEFSKTSADVTENLLKLHSYALGNERERAFHFDRIYNAEHQVYHQTSDGPIFASVKWCGAKGNSLSRYADRKRKISQYYQRAVKKIGFSAIVYGDRGYDDIYNDFLLFCRSFGFKNSAAGLPHSDSRNRTFWSIGYKATSMPQNFPDEVENAQDYLEGATKKVAVNAYERNRKARMACIAHYGWECKGCGIDFVERYGSIGKEFIHVHHLKLLSEIGKQYKVDPIKDLIPVCPNCHAMIHRRTPTLSIKELVDILNPALCTSPSSLSTGSRRPR